MDIDSPVLSATGLQRFQELRGDAINAVTERFYSSHESIYAQYGQRGRDACREDLAFHLDFMRPVLEFGLIQPMVDYLRWLSSVLITRDIPSEHLALSLEWFAEFFADHMQGTDAQAVAQALHTIQERYEEADQAPPAIYAKMPEPWPESATFESALLAGDRRSAASLLGRCLEEGRGLVDVELHMIQPALYGIGRKWQRNEVTVVQEHLATAISQAVMTDGLLQSTVPAANGSRIVLACVEGNHHAVGLQMVADAYQLAGWEVQYLGANVPTNALLQHIAQYQPDLLGLSVSFAQQLRVVKDIMSRMTQTFGNARPPVIIGGLAINQFDPLVGQLGADASSPDARSAVDSGLQFALASGSG